MTAATPNAAAAESAPSPCAGSTGTLLCGVKTLVSSSKQEASGQGLCLQKAGELCRDGQMLTC